jgi:death-on-curing protein
MMKLTREQILAMQAELIAEFGGRSGLRDEGLFESALAAPFQTFDGQEMLSTVQQKAARLGFGLIMNHPFNDGNKRIGAHAMLVSLAINGIELDYTQEELYSAILEVTSGNISFGELLDWVLAHEIQQ